MDKTEWGSILICNWEDIKDEKWNNLLLGNGFSTNIWKNYSYQSLYKYSIDNSIDPPLIESIQNIFKNLQDINFEEVLRAIAYTILVKNSLGEETERYLQLYETVQQNLFNTVYAVHVEYSKLDKSALAQEIKSFKNVFTTCYDLILYWSSYGALNPNAIADFFWSNDSNAFDPTNTQTSKARFYYLHGALHLKQDLNGTVSKLRYTSDKLPASSDFKYQGEKTQLPLYIAEGNSEYKLKKIKSNNYLSFCYHSFSSISGSLLVIGHSLNKEFDNHLIEAIKHNINLKAVGLSIYSELTQLEKEQLVKDLEAKLHRKDLELFFFESNTHPLINESVKVQA